MDLPELRLGKKAPVHDPRTLVMAKYLDPRLGPPPKVVSRTRGVAGWGMLGNDRLGDCTIAAVIHGVMSWHLSLEETLLPATDAIALDYYGRWCGWRPDQPESDQGGVELEVLNRWRQQGIQIRGYTHNIKAHADIDYRDLDSVKHCIDLFGFVYLGLALPRSIQDQQTWSPAPGRDGIPGTWGLHAVIADNYDHEVILLNTWGRQQEATWAWFLECCDEAHGVISDTDWLNPDGWSRDDLVRDLAAVTA